MPHAIDFNSDLGEGFGRWTLGDDKAMLPHVTSANVACGFHAGDFEVMNRSVALCNAARVGVGAQPGHLDLQGFGRRAMQLTPAEAEGLILYQMGALYAFCRAHGVELTHVKPHGALYNQAPSIWPWQVGSLAAWRASAATSRCWGWQARRRSPQPPADAGVHMVPESFADRRYNPDGTLQSRSIACSLLTDPAEAAAQALSIAPAGVVVAHDGSRIPVAANSICFHGDTPGAQRIVASARSTLEPAGLAVRRFA